MQVISLSVYIRKFSENIIYRKVLTRHTPPYIPKERNGRQQWRNGMVALIKNVAIN